MNPEVEEVIRIAEKHFAGEPPEKRKALANEIIQAIIRLAFAIDRSITMFKCNCPHEVRGGCSEPECPHYVRPCLLACPFCGSDGQTLLRGFCYPKGSSSKKTAIMCPTCEARAPLSSWERRVNQQSTMERK